MYNVLVTGGAGFIGSSLAEKLLEYGYGVAVVDNFNDYYDPAIKEHNIDSILKQMKAWGIPDRNFKLFRKDIRDKAELAEVFDRSEAAMVIHLAAMAGVRPSIEMPELYYDVNINGTLNVLEESRKRNIKDFIFASSSSVYGNNKKLPFSEDDPVDNPISPYAASKKAGELLCYTYHHLYSINIACLRFFTVYGPRQRPDLAIHKFTRLMLKGDPIPLYGTGSTARDYTYIGDIVDGIMKTMKWLKDAEGVYEIFNIGESRVVSLKDMIFTLERALGKKALLEQMTAQPGDVDITFADISKAKHMLGYLPNKDFGEGIVDFVRWLETER